VRVDEVRITPLTPNLGGIGEKIEDTPNIPAGDEFPAPLYHPPFNSLPSREGKLSTLSLRRGEGQGEGFPDNDKLDFT
jgi:hypothetical protein